MERLRRENAEIKAAAPKGWQDFEQLANAKGLTSMKEMAKAVGVDVPYLKTCKEHNRVTFQLVQKLIQAPDESWDEQLADANSERDKFEDRCRVVERALRDPDFLAFRLRSVDIPLPLPPEAAKKRPRSDMGSAEFKDVLKVLFPKATSDAARCNLLSVIAGYFEFSHRSHAGLLKSDGGSRKPQVPSDELAAYLRALRAREEGQQHEAPVQTKRAKRQNPDRSPITPPSPASRSPIAPHSADDVYDERGRANGFCSGSA